MDINDIDISSKWEDVLGKAKCDKNGKEIKGIRLKREVIITDKTSSSIEYRDEGGFLTWISIEDFIRVEKLKNCNRFIKSKYCPVV